MSEINIHRPHQLGLEAARKIAQEWAVQAQEKYELECAYEQGDTQDTLCFSRTGIKGSLDVLPGALNFHAKLGFLFSAFHERIESKLNEQIDQMLGEQPTALPAEPM